MVRKDWRVAGWALCGLLCLNANVAFAEGTRTWSQSKYEEFSKGTATGVAINHSGGIELSPEIKQAWATPSTYLWAVAVDDAGNVYAAAGSPARVYRVSPDGKAAVIFEAKELQVQAIAVVGTAVYAATAPDGKLYRLERNGGKTNTAPGKPDEARKDKDKDAPPVDPAWVSTEVFAPKTKYIWALAADAQGNIFVATGDPGEIYKVTPKGEHTLFFKSDETHIRSLVLDGKGNLIAGSDGSGLVYRISAAGEGFVLYSAPKKEITALAIDGTGNIYAAATGEKRAGSSSTSSLAVPFAGIGVAAPGAVTPLQTPGTGAQPGQSGMIGGIGPLVFPGTTGGGSEVYRLAADGTPVRLWSSREELVYALAMDAGGRLVAGTGNRGRIVTITGVDEYSDTAKATSAQVTALALARNGTVYAAASNLGKLFSLGPKTAAEGTFESEVFDAKAYSRWGRVEFRGAGNVELFVRSGNVDNPDRNWSPWKKTELGKDTEAEVPVARFAQWKAVLHAGNAGPRVDSVALNYLPRNLAPEVDEVTVQAGVRYQAQPKSTLPADSGAPGLMSHFEPTPSSSHDRDAVGIKWNAHDDNEDQLLYSIYYRGDGESQWLLLKDKISDKAYSFDTSLLPDGGYTVKVIASDALSHAPGEALTGAKESARFEVDSTPPRIEELAASVESGQLHVRFRAVDGFSPIGKAEYSVDAGEWQYVEPVGQISDAKSEDYDFRAAVPAGPEHVVVVRAYDRYENLGAAKTVVRGK